MSRNRVENRAHLIYEFLSLHMGEGFTLPQLCEELDIEPGSTTRTAIRRARDLATEVGLHFPPAVPQNGSTYRVTNLAADAFDPTLQMGRVRRGVEDREAVGVEFMRQERNKLDPADRPLVDSYIEVYDTTAKALASIRKSFDDTVMYLVSVRRKARDLEDTAA